MNHCSACSIRMFPKKEWALKTAFVRSEWSAAGLGRAHEGRGLCERCYARAKRNGTLLDYGRSSVSKIDVAEEWFHSDLPRDLSKSERIRRLAPRLGMKPKALERSLLRAGVFA